MGIRELGFTYLSFNRGTSGGLTVSKLDYQTFTSEFESHWAPLSFGLVPHLSKELFKLLSILQPLQIKV